MGVSMGGRGCGGRVAGSRARLRTPLDDRPFNLEAVHARAALGVSRASQTGGEREAGLAAYKGNPMLVCQFWGDCAKHQHEKVSQGALVKLGARIWCVHFVGLQRGSSYLLWLARCVAFDAHRRLLARLSVQSRLMWSTVYVGSSGRLPTMSGHASATSLWKRLLSYVA